MITSTAIPSLVVTGVPPGGPRGDQKTLTLVLEATIQDACRAPDTSLTFGLDLSTKRWRRSARRHSLYFIPQGPVQRTFLRRRRLLQYAPVGTSMWGSQ